MGRPLIRTIVSGGQTGVDRGALEAASTLDVPVAGWCPAGGWAEDRTTPPGIRADFPELRETPLSDPAQRTRWNVRDSDATLVLAPPLQAGTPGGPISPGTRLTVVVARTLGRPVLVVDRQSAESVAAWLHRIGRDLRLNVAGPRASEWADGRERAFALVCALGRARGDRLVR